MTITASSTVNGSANEAGFINWPNPTASASNITATCTDADGDTDQQTWSITVSTTIGPDGFCFLDADTGSDSGTGSLLSPYRTMAKLKEDPLDPCARAVVYLRDQTPGGGNTYNWTSFPLQDGTEAQLREDRGEPVILIAYPGDTMPTLDYDDHNPGNPPNLMYLRGQNIWVEGIRHQDCGGKCMGETERTSRYGSVIWRNLLTGGGPGVDSSNTAYIMYVSQVGSESYHDIVANNVATDIQYGSSFNFVKAYAQIEPVYINNDVTNVHSYTGEADAMFSMKADIQDFSIINNNCSGLPVQVPCIGGSQHEVNVQVRGEVLFNNALAAGGYAAIYNDFGASNATVGPFYSYRNTYQGRVQVNGADTGDLYSFVRDVIANTGGSGGSCPQRITCSGVVNFSTISIAATVLQGLADGSIVSTSTGLLQGSNLTNYGPSSADPRGHARQ
jgi:hypothetical protein